MRKRGSSYLPFTRKRRQQNVIIPKKKKPAENIDGFVSGLRGPSGLFLPSFSITHQSWLSFR
jgi:hypothetical protein